MKISAVGVALCINTAVLAQWTCDPGFQCGATIIHRDDSAFWVQTLKDAETRVGRRGRDPLWDLFRCNGNRTASFVQSCIGRCLYGGPGRDRCEGELLKSETPDE
ncbi:hypothetical protein CCM_08948 [Cordyceps militaris CM01]|uniref:Uncharacterized protein n=2 Tax=Cordyceps militaris TaxID=73501 RepID=G3JSQ5_CORMM|nr:uncharacterized protein CCM_08948 [Cordyceps militaris CM01]ATY61698.1 hypothetical protein A9K55_009199 [Cordyceps militaris]EGX88901.1 hypothetical protein CCM_08948 [Cordyceps militaris CM01]